MLLLAWKLEYARLGPLEQLAAGWRPDIPSLLLGLALGLALIYLVARVRPVVIRWGRSVVGRWRRTQERFQAGIEVRYRRELLEHVQALPLGPAPVPFGQVVVPPRVLPPLQTLEFDSSPTTFDLLDQIWPEVALAVAPPASAGLSVPDLLARAGRIAISALPGAGTSTLLAYAAYRCLVAATSDAAPGTGYEAAAAAAAAGETALLASRVPVLLHVVELEPTRTDDPVAALVAALQQRLSPLAGRNLEPFIRQALEHGRLLLLLDGWNELTPAARQPVTAWLDRLLLPFPELSVIVAAPATGFGPLVELDFAVAGLQPWRAGQAASLFEGWRKALDLGDEGAATGREAGAGWRAGQTPLEIFYHYWLGRAGPPRPGRRQDLFEAALSQHLAGDQPTAMPVVARRAFWGRLALTLVREPTRVLDRATVKALAEEVAGAHGESSGQGGRALLASLKQTPLFVNWPNGRVGLRHTLWRDFLAADALARAPDSALTAPLHNEPEWGSVRRFYVSRQGAAGPAQHLLNQAQDGSWSGLFETAAWAAEVTDDSDWQREVLTRLGRLSIQSDLPLSVRQRAVVAIAQTQLDGVLSFMRQLLQRHEAPIRQAAAGSLIHFEPEAVVELLRGLLKRERDGAVRLTAVATLAALEDPAAETALLHIMLDGDDRLAQAVAEHLALRGREGWAILREAAQESDLQLRRTATFGLALLDEAWAELLLKRLDRSDKEWIVKTAARSALAAIEERRRGRRWRRPYPGDQAWLVQWAADQGETVPGGLAALPVVLRIMQAERETGLRRLAALSLGFGYVQEARADLVKLAETGDPGLRDAVVCALGLLERAAGEAATN